MQQTEDLDETREYLEEMYKKIKHDSIFQKGQLHQANDNYQKISLDFIKVDEENKELKRDFTEKDTIYR